MPSRVVVPLAVLFFLVQSCATTTTTVGTKTFSPDQVHEIVRANQSRVLTIAGDGTISVETPAMAQSGSFILTLRKPDSLLVNLQGPFGIKIGSALLTRKGFQFYNSLQNRLFTGVTNPRNLARVLRVDIDFDDVLNLFTGGIFQREDTGRPDETGKEDGQFTVLYKNAGGNHKYFIDPQTLLITKIQNLDRDGKLEFEQRFLNFQTVDSVLVPFNIRIIQPKERRMVSVVYSDLTLNKQNLHFTFSYPQSAERVHWK